MDDGDRLYNTVFNSWSNKSISYGTIPLLVADLMLNVERYKLPGHSKKKLVLTGLKMFVERANLTTEQKLKIYDFIEDAVPVIIDLLVSVDKRKIIIASNKCMWFG